MSEDYELRTFSGRPDKLTRRIITQQNDRSSRFRECKHFIERLKPGRADAADERRIRDCFAMDAPPSIVTPPLPPFELILWAADALPARSEEHTSELQSLMRISYAVFCLKKKKIRHKT